MVGRLAKFVQPEIIFLILGIVSGLIFVIITPPFQVPDEYQHIYKAFAISKGEFFADQTTLPGSISDLINETRNLPFKPDGKIQPGVLIKYLKIPMSMGDEVTVKFPNVGVYTPLPYVMTGLGSLVARLLDVPSGLFVYIVRLFNLIAWLGLAFLGLRTVPVFKWVFTFLLLSPMSLSIAASASADCITNGLSFLGIAYCLNLGLQHHEKVTNRDILYLILLTMLLGLCKPPYVILMGLVLLIPWKRYQSGKQFIVLMVMMGAALAISLSFTALLMSEAHDVKSFRGIDPQEQAGFIIEHPRSFLNRIFLTFLNYQEYWRSYVGVLGWLDTPLPGYVYPIYFIVALILSILDGQQEFPINWIQKMVLVGISLLITVIVMVFMFLTWTPLKSEIVEGLQGRYFIPHAPLLFFGFYNTKVKFAKLLPVLTCTATITFISVTVYTLIYRYYVII